MDLTQSKFKVVTLLKSSSALILIAIFLKILGYIEKVVLAYYWGTSYEGDLYNVAITLLLSVFFFFREIIEPGYLNSFLKAIKDNQESCAWLLFNRYFIFTVGITLMLSVFAFIDPVSIVTIIAPGFDKFKQGITAYLIRWTFPATIFLSLTALTNITLNGLKQFVLPTFSDIGFKTSILLSLLIFYPTLGFKCLIVGILAGSIVKLIMHLILLQQYYKFQKSIVLDLHYAINAWKLTWPLIIGVLFSQLSSLADNAFASYLPTGSVSALTYAKKIADLPVIVFPYIFSVVIFPYFSELAINNDNRANARLLAQSLCWIVTIFLPTSIFLFSFSKPVVELVFQRGMFDAHSTLLTTGPLTCYSIGLVFFAIETILVVFYFANSDTRTPVTYGIISVIENIVLGYFFVQYLGANGLAIALVIAKATKVLALLFLLKEKIYIDFRTTSLFILNNIIASLLTIGVVYLLSHWLNYSSNIIYKFLQLLYVFVLTMTSYCGVLYFLKPNKQLLFEKW